MMSKEPDLALKITTSLLNGKDYITWDKSTNLYLHGTLKIGFIKGKIAHLEKDNPTEDEWDAHLGYWPR